MSLILDALSRAERDRRLEENPAPDLLADHGVAARPAATVLPRILVVAMLIALVAGAALWLLPRDEQEIAYEAAPPDRMGQSALPDSPAPPSVQTPGTSAADPGTAAADSRAGPGLPRSASPGTAADPARLVAAPASESISPAEIASLYERSRKQVVETNGGAADDTGSAAVAASADPPAETVKPATEAVTRAEEPVDLEQVLRRARSEAAASRLSEHPVPLLQTLTKQYRDRVPTLMYLRHDYNPVGTSVVLINGQTLSIGDRSRGVEVREILADSVILRFEEREFRLRALNSWVNL